MHHDLSHPGNRAGGTGPEVVFKLFAGTAPTYDEVVERTTLGLDSHWKRLILREIARPSQVLDLASGTGILSFLIATAWPDCSVTGIELQEAYCAIARQRACERLLSDRVRFVCSPAETAPLAAERYDCVTTSYLPKYAHLDVLVPRLYAAMVTGGKLIFHDFVWPASAGIRSVLEDNFAACLAAAKGADSEWVTMFSELPGVIRESRWVDELVDELRAAGFRNIASRPVSVGCAAIVTAVK